MKVLTCEGDGDLFTIQSGIMQIKQTSQTNTSRRGIVNLSLGGIKSTLLDTAVASLTTENLVVVVSAGNSGTDACQYSPANLGGISSTKVISVGASDVNDDRPSWSNTGSCVSISAPGSGIRGAWFTTDTSSTLLSGTSMAAPLVSGTAALVLQQNLSMSVLEVKNSILSWATPNIVQYTTSSGGGKNLLYSLIDIHTQPLFNSPPPSTVTLVVSYGGISKNIISMTSIIVILLIHVLQFL